MDSPALSGVRVLDLSRVLAGPLCTMILGDLGADVIKVERPGQGDETRQWGPPWVSSEGGRESAYFLAINRNKRSVMADLSRADGQRLVRRLVADADVLVENFVPGTLDRWSLGYAELSAENPRLVFCSISGYGTVGPDAGLPGYDFAVQGRSGWMAITGEADGPPMKVGVAVVDVLTGQNAAIAILAALRERERSGRGQRIEVALIDSALAGLVNVAQAALAGSPIARYGNAHPTIVPYQAFETADGIIVVAVGNDVQWRRFCETVGRRDLAEDDRYATNPSRVERRSELVPILRSLMVERSSAEWIALFEEVGVPCGPVNRVEEAIRDPAVVERAGLWTLVSPAFGQVESVASPLRLDRTPASLRRPPPGLGEHDAEISERGWGP